MKKIILLIALLLVTSNCFAVDNSTSKYFPPIEPQEGGACAPHAMIYYNYSYEYSKRMDKSYRFSPRLAWDELDVGGGANLHETLMFMINYGSPKWDKYGQLDMWENAAKHKIKTAEYIQIDQKDIPSVIQRAKEELANGYLLSFGTHYGSWEWKKIENGSGNAVYWVDHTAGDHAMTLVGYDDTLWVDINDNDIQEPQEMGCFKAVDGKGFYWIAYDSLYVTSTLEGAPVDPIYRHTSFDTALHKLVLYEPLVEKQVIAVDKNYEADKKEFYMCNFKSAPKTQLTKVKNCLFVRCNLYGAEVDDTNALVKSNVVDTTPKLVLTLEELKIRKAELESDLSTSNKQIPKEYYKEWIDRLEEINEEAIINP